MGRNINFNGTCYNEIVLELYRITQRRDMHAERYCLYCNELLGKDWARPDQKYCDSSCRASFWYRKKYKKFYEDRYKRQKIEWARSSNGKLAGVSLSAWRRLPKEWK